MLGSVLSYLIFRKITQDATWLTFKENKNVMLNYIFTSRLPKEGISELKSGSDNQYGK